MANINDQRDFPLLMYLAVAAYQQINDVMIKKYIVIAKQMLHDRH